MEVITIVGGLKVSQSTPLESRWTFSFVLELIAAPADELAVANVARHPPSSLAIWCRLEVEKNSPLSGR